MALDANALVALTDLKVCLAVENSDADPLLEMFINQVSTLIQTFLERNLIEATYTGLLLDGPDSEFLYLPDWPVSTLGPVSVYENGTLLVADVDYKLYPARGYLHRLDGKWAEGKQNIKVTFTAGYKPASVPRDIQYLAINKIAREYLKQKSSMWGQTSRSMTDGSFNFEFPLALDEDEERILGPHRRMIL